MTNFNLSIDSNANVDAIVTALKNQGVTINKVFANIRVINVSTPDALHLAITERGIAFVEEEQTVTPITQTSWQQLRVASDTLPLRRDARIVYRGTGVTLYLVDTGIDKTHPELSTATIVDLWSHDNTFTPAIHGTTLATLIVGKTNGVAQGVTLKQVHIPVGTGVSVTTLLSALDAILTDHNATPGVKVINCSWVIEKSQILDNEISKLEAAGLVVVAAAGNQGLAANDFSPVGLDSVLGVAASDAYDRVIKWGGSNISNFGPEVDITAPGIEVDVIKADGTAGIESGTSVAAAITSGVVTHFIERYPAATAEEIQAAVLDYASVDVLFRNEQVFGTTPNRLLQTYNPSNVDAWNVSFNTKIAIKHGTTETIAITASAPITAITLENFDFANGHNYIVPTWTSYQDGVLTVSPPIGILTGTYPVILTGTDANNTVYRLAINVSVFETDVSELASKEGENYFNTQNEIVTLKLAFCSTDHQCDGGSCITRNCCRFSNCTCCDKT